MLLKAKLVFTLVASVATAGVTSLHERQSGDVQDDVQVVQQHHERLALAAAHASCASGCELGRVLMPHR